MGELARRLLRQRRLDAHESMANGVCALHRVGEVKRHSEKFPSPVRRRRARVGESPTMIALFSVSISMLASSPILPRRTGAGG